MASVSIEECDESLLKGYAMSKIYELSPSGFEAENEIMFVIPLFDSHNYDYDNMTLMYREDRGREFFDADDMKNHKPTWVFHGNICYVFLNHFCGIYVKMNSSNTELNSITLQSLLFYKLENRTLELVTTFGCYNRDSSCSNMKVTQVFDFNIEKNENILCYLLYFFYIWFNH